MKPYIRKVRYYETDQMGVMHHSNYVRLFEEARMDYWDQAGLNYQKMEDEGVLVPVLACHCHYKKPLRFSEEFTVVSSVKFFNGVRFQVEYQIYGENSKAPVAIGETEHCFADKNLHPLRIARSHPKLMKLVQETLLLQDANNNQ